MTNEEARLTELEERCKRLAAQLESTSQELAVAYRGNHELILRNHALHAQLAATRVSA